MLLATLVESRWGGRFLRRLRTPGPLLGAGPRSDLESAPLREMAAASDRVARLVALAPRLRTLSARTATVAADAAQLSASNAPERQLSSRGASRPWAAAPCLISPGFSTALSATRLPFRRLRRRRADRVASLHRAGAIRRRRPRGAGLPDGRATRGRPLRGGDAALPRRGRAGVFEQLRLGRSRPAAFVIAKLSELEVTAQLAVERSRPGFSRSPPGAGSGSPSSAGDQLERRWRR